MKRTRTLALASAVAVLSLSTAALAHDTQQRKGPRLDVVFVIDTTGSMGDEIDVVKQRLHAMVSEISSGQPRPDVRFGMVAFRDRGDAYVVSPVELSRDVNSFARHIHALQADGGGDEPEDVAAALSYAIDRMNWDQNGQVSRMVFLIGDAGPQQYQGQPTMQLLASRAKEKRIKITAIGCSGLGPDAELAFRTVAMGTGGAFDFLTYRQVVARADGSRATVLTRAGETYEAEGALDDSVWKKGADSLAKRGVAAKPAAPSAAPVTHGENNLDALITGSIKSEATAAGVKY